MALHALDPARSYIGFVEGLRLINSGQLADQAIGLGVDPDPLPVVTAFEEGCCPCLTVVSDHLYRVDDFDVVETAATIVSTEADPNDMR